VNFSVPWDCSSIEELVMMIKSQPVRFNVKIPVSENSKDFILKCLQAKETKRFTFEMMFEHKLLKENEMIKSKRTKDTNFQNLKQKFQNNIIKIQLEYFRMQSELKTIFNQVDNDNDNSTLNFTEFATILKNFNQNLSFRDQKELFDLFDEDQSGLISQDEFIQILFNTSFAEQKDN
jgi:serine/threonine protein kinase